MLIGECLNQNLRVIFFNVFSDGVDKVNIGIADGWEFAAFPAFAIVSVAIILIDAVKYRPVFPWLVFTVFFNKEAQFFGKKFSRLRLAVAGFVF